MSSLDRWLYAPISKPTAVEAQANSPAEAVEAVIREEFASDTEFASATADDVIADVIPVVEDCLDGGEDVRLRALEIVIPKLQAALDAARGEYRLLGGYSKDKLFASQIEASMSLIRGFNAVLGIHAGQPDAYLKATEVLYETTLQFATEVERHGIDGYADRVRKADIEVEPDHCDQCNAPQMVLPNGEHVCGTKGNA